MIIDLHVHTRHYSGCSNIVARDLFVQAKKVGLDAVVLTEHGILWKEEKLAPLQEEAAKNGLILLAGQEITCVEKARRQDFLVFGLKESLGAVFKAKDLVRVVHEQGGLVVAAHPYKPSRFGEGYYGVGDDIYNLELDAVELYHPEHDEKALKKIQVAAAKLGIPMTGGSDAHEIYQVGQCSTRLFNNIETMEELVLEIMAQRIEPINGSVV